LVFLFRVEQSAAEVQFLGAQAIGHEPVVADTLKAGGQDVQ